MFLPEFCIKRPVFTIVMMVVMMVVGSVSFSYLTVRQYPEVETPIITVRTTYEGASPEIMETQVTRPLEGALAGIEGLDTMTSISEQEESRIKLTFKPNRDLDNASNDVRDRLGRIKGRLPKEADDPTVRKSDSDDEPILYLAITSDKTPVAEIFNYADKYLKNEVEALSGVANVEVYGSSPYVMHLWLDPARLAAYRITPTEINEALVQQNIEIPAGRLVSVDREFMVTTSANLKTPEDFNNLILSDENGFLVRLKDVGYAEFSPQDDRSYVTFNGKEAVAIAIVKKSTSNPLDLAKDLYKALPDLQASLSKGMKIEVAYDKTLYIQSSIDAVYRTIWEATAFVIVVVFLFLWSMRGAIIPLITIPVSLVFTFSLLYLFGFSINILTLLALVLAIGLVVDDAIVVLENIYRHIEEGMPPFKAALVGSKEIAFAVIAMTITLAAVYAPIALSQGMIGTIFTEFALTLAGAVIISGFIALTLSPMMCAYLLKSSTHGSQKAVQQVPRHPLLAYLMASPSPNVKALDAIDALYARSLQKLSCVKVRVLVGAFLFGLAGIGLAKYALKSELAPPDDKGVVLGKGEGPRTATIQYMVPYVKQIDKIFNDLPEVENQLTVVTLPTVMSYNLLTPWNKRSLTAAQIINKIKLPLYDITGIWAWPSAGASFFGGGGANAEALQFVIQTTRPYEDLLEMAHMIQVLIQRNPGVERVNADISGDDLEYSISIDRDKAGSLGISEETIAKTLDTLVSGRVVTKLKDEGQQYDVRTQLIAKHRQAPENIDSVYVKSRVGDNSQMIPLSTVVDVKTRSIPTEINHFNQLRSIVISAELKPGYSMGEAVKFLQEVKDKALPDDFRTDYAGETRRFIESQNTLYLIFSLAIIFIYLVMAAQFESFIDPFIIILTVPLSLTGALLLLWMTGGTLNIFSQIGLVTLIGLITKHGILIVDFANKLRQDGLSKEEAIFKGARQRLRPILMTTAAMVLGALPLTFASGAGASGRQEIGWVIVGGMTFGTFLTLFVVPFLYLFLSRKKAG